MALLSRGRHPAVVPENHETVESVKIVLLAIVAAVAYGIVHDEVTARVLRRVFHRRPPARLSDRLTDSPRTRLGDHRDLVGRPPPRSAARLRGQARRATKARGSRPREADRLSAHRHGDLGAPGGDLRLLRDGGRRRRSRRATSLSDPQGPPRSFFADAWAHGASYGIGSLGGVVVCVLTWRRRGRSSAPVPISESSPVPTRHRREPS
jgi:hypothetical protein